MAVTKGLVGQVEGLVRIFLTTLYAKMPCCWARLPFLSLCVLDEIDTYCLKCRVSNVAGRLLVSTVNGCSTSVFHLTLATGTAHCLCPPALHRIYMAIQKAVGVALPEAPPLCRVAKIMR